MNPITQTIQQIKDAIQSQTQVPAPSETNPNAMQMVYTISDPADRDTLIKEWVRLLIILGNEYPTTPTV